jgi:hypothetical protein
MNSKASFPDVNAMKSLCLFMLWVSIAILAGCGENKSKPAEERLRPKHEHKPPHGGTPVVLGNEEHHLELVLNPLEGRMVAYIMDGELENFQRITAESFKVTVHLAGQEKTLLFNAVPNNATGEKIGDTSMFEAQAAWLKAAKSFDAVVPQIEVRGTTYTNIEFNFPKGNDKDEKH